MRIVVIGAGIAGLSFAIACERNGMQVTVCERERTLAPVGAGIVLHPNGMSVLDRLGVGHEVQECGAVLRTLRLHKPSRTVVVDLRQVWEGAGQPSIGVSRTDLHRVLLAAASKCELKLDRRLQTLHVAGSSLHATFRDGSAEQCDVLIVADGVHSTARTLLGMPAARPLGLWYFRFCTGQALGPHDEWQTYEACSANGLNVTFGFVPISADEVHVFAQIVSTEPPFHSEEVALRWLTTEGAEMFPALERALKARSTPVHYGPAFEAGEQCWRHEHVAFIGDAAHAVAPTFSEGASLAMEDAVVLADLLAALPGPSQLASALAAYEARRRDRLRWAARICRQQVNSLHRAEPGTKPVLSDDDVLRYMRGMYQPLLQKPWISTSEHLS